MRGTPWLKEYKKYIVNIVVFDNTSKEALVHHDEITRFGIVFKFPNGYQAIVEFYAYDELLEGYYDGYVVCMDVSVEMLTKTGESFTDVSFEMQKNDKFPDRRRKDIALKHEVEEFLKKVMEI